MDRISPTFDWESFLAIDSGCLPPPQDETPVVKRSAVAPRARRVEDGISVVEHSDSGIMKGIVNASLFVETRWTCVCGTSFRKAGRHTGTLRTCRSCGAKFFLRMVPLK